MFIEVENNITNSLAVIAEVAITKSAKPGKALSATKTEHSVLKSGSQNAICWKQPESKNLWDLSHMTLNASNPLKPSLFRCGATRTASVSTKALAHSVFTALLLTPELKTIFL